MGAGASRREEELEVGAGKEGGEKLGGGKEGGGKGGGGKEAGGKGTGGKEVVGEEDKKEVHASSEYSDSSLVHLFEARLRHIGKRSPAPAESYTLYETVRGRQVNVLSHSLAIACSTVISSRVVTAFDTSLCLPC